MAKVSAIIPAYNCEGYIKETIESVFSQTYRDIELIVVDDASSDRTGEIARNFGTRLKYLHQSKNTGPSGARNMGIDEASGEYIAFLDHDDVWLPNKIEEQVKLLEGNKDLALVYCNGYNVDLAGRETETLFDISKPYRGFVFEQLILDNFIPTSSVVVKKNILDEVGRFNERFLISQDFDLYLRITQFHKIDFVDSPLFKHRLYPGSASNKQRKVLLDDTISITKFYQEQLSHHNLPLAQKLGRRIAKYMFYRAIWSLEHTTKPEAFRRYLGCFEKGCPDYRIVLAVIFFILPRFVALPLVKKLIKIQGGF